MHPCYTPVRRRARVRWVARMVAAYATAELLAEVWEWVRPRPKLVGEVKRRRGWACGW